MTSVQAFDTIALGCCSQQDVTHYATFILVLGLLCACDSKTPQADPELPDPPCGTRDSMVGLKRLDTGECFWMDARPVSQQTYYDAVQSGMAFSDHPACADHDEHAPHMGPDRSFECYRIQDYDPATLQSGAAQNLDWPPGSRAQTPMYCATWCDAEAYCAHVGKRLCRATDVGPFDVNAAQASELQAMCTAGSGDSAVILGESAKSSSGCGCYSSPPACEGPYGEMWCIANQHFFVESDVPAVRAVDVANNRTVCDRPTMALAGATPYFSDFAKILCCAD